MLFLLIAICLGPLLLAWISYKTEWYRGKPSVNFGTLITPPIQIGELEIKKGRGELQELGSHKHAWLLVYTKPRICKSICINNLYKMRQVRLATGKEMSRIQRVVLGFADQPEDPALKKLLENQYKGTKHWTVSRQAFEASLGHTPRLSQGNAIYIVDPLNNLMMVYPNNANAEGMRKDLLKLLKLSKIG